MAVPGRITEPVVEYQRNGSGGDGFWQVHFTYERDGSHQLIGIIPSWAVEAGSPRNAAELAPSGCVPCYVVHASDPKAWWRGDNFADDLLDLINAHPYRQLNVPEAAR